MKSFTFIVLCYNHDKYVVEHLESIYMLVKNFGEKFKTNIIITDDCSTDSTKHFTERWIEEKGEIFSRVNFIFNSENLGTCKTLIKALSKCDTDFCKITGADDIYTFTNIYHYLPETGNEKIISGMPIRLQQERVKINWFEVINFYASKRIFNNRPFLQRLSYLSIINAPNLIYPLKLIKNNEVINFLKRFDVVEDFALQIALAVTYPKIRYMEVDETFVLYRRTEGSTFIIANKRFENDQIKLLSYLEALELNKKRISAKLSLKFRRYFFNRKHSLLKIMFNVPRAIYLLLLIQKLPLIIADFFSVRIDIQKHTKHYKLIQNIKNK